MARAVSAEQDVTAPRPALGPCQESRRVSVAGNQGPHLGTRYRTCTRRSERSPFGDGTDGLVHVGRQVPIWGTQEDRSPRRRRTTLKARRDLMSAQIRGKDAIIRELQRRGLTADGVSEVSLRSALPADELATFEALIEVDPVEDTDVFIPAYIRLKGGAA